MNIDAALLMQDLQNLEVPLEQATKTLQELSLNDFLALLEQTLSVVAKDDEPVNDNWFRPVSEALSQRLQRAANPSEKKIGDAEVFDRIGEAIGQIYAALGPQHPLRYQLLTCLAHIASQHSLGLLAEKLVVDPPQGIGPATVPLVTLCRQLPAGSAAALFPQLLSALENPEVAPAVLDLSNYLTRSGQTDRHPALSQTNGLLKLTEAVVADLEPLQGIVENAEELQERQQRVARSLPLAISLCDTLGLIGDDRAIPTLQRMSELKHRRLRVEASTARIRLKEEAAVEDLVAMAAEPSVRMRVLAYAEELDLTERLPEEMDTPVARAEAELVAYLIQPTQMGLPPLSCELLDTRTLYWPSYEEPRNSYLFRYEYQVQTKTGPETYINLGIAGPLVHTLHTDLTDLPFEDVYAIFAGWQAEHDEIKHREINPDASVDSLPDVVGELIKTLPDDFTSVQPRIFALFFGQPVIIATAQKGTALGSIVIEDQTDPLWFPMINERSVGPGEAWLIYKGRHLLDSFNDDWTESR